MNTKKTKKDRRGFKRTVKCGIVQTKPDGKSGSCAANNNNEKHNEKDNTMNKKSNKVPEKRPATIINADINDFRKGTPCRWDRLIEALKPITDEWFPQFREAAQTDTDALVDVWGDYRHAMFATIKRPTDDTFREIALVLMLASVMFAVKKSETFAVIELIIDSTLNTFRFFYPEQMFPVENEIIREVKSIHTLMYR